MKQYLNTGVYLSPCSTTAKLLAAGKPKEAAAAFKESGHAFERQYPDPEHRKWFTAVSKGEIPLHSGAVEQE